MIENSPSTHSEAPTLPRSARASIASSASVRLCVGCGTRVPHDAGLKLIRVVLNAQGESATVVPDLRGGTFGRGAHVHAEAACIEQAVHHGFARAFRRAIQVTSHELARAIVEAADRRLEGLLLGALRGGHVLVGTEAVVEGISGGAVTLVLLAADAQAAAARNEVRRATAAGQTLVFGDRGRLARVLQGRGEAEMGNGIAICALTHGGLAGAVRDVWVCREALRPLVSKVFTTKNVAPADPRDDKANGSEAE